tara:strand:- start:9709 stop:10026 length:318 start_codon:yes stop_codon:yes gene_type:complete
MYAVIMTGGKQYKVSKGDIISIEKLDTNAGETIKFDKILLISDGKKVEIGKPFVDNGVIEGKVMEQTREKKVDIIKFKRRKHYKKHQGHRQYITKVEITKISGAK